MPDLNLRVRYFQDSTPEGIPCREENFQRREIMMSLPVKQAALVLVDLWNLHFIESWIERARRVTAESIVPILAIAREVGFTIIHAPTPLIAPQFPQLKRHTPPPPAVEPDWPPAEFRRREGQYYAYRGPRSQPPGIWIHRDKLYHNLGMSPIIEVRDDDYVIATGDQLQETLKWHQILHLLYVGFATNWCILGRDYAIRAMVGRGYNTILLRDATTGVEFPDTLPTLLATELAVREAEQVHGFSASNEDFFAACRAVLQEGEHKL